MIYRLFGQQLLSREPSSLVILGGSSGRSRDPRGFLVRFHIAKTLHVNPRWAADGGNGRIVGVADTQVERKLDIVTYCVTMGDRAVAEEDWREAAFFYRVAWKVLSDQNI